MKSKFFMTMLIVPLAFLAFKSCERIDSGHEGILVNLYGSNKGVSGVSLVSGSVWHNPFTQEVHEYPTYVKTIDYPSFSLNCLDGSKFTVDPTLSISIIPGQSPRIFKKYRTDVDSIYKKTIYGLVKDAFRLGMNNYTTEEIVSNRRKFEKEVQDYLYAALKKEGFYGENLTSGLDYPKSIVDAINNKNKAVQEIQESINRLKKDSIDGRRKIIKAEAEYKANELISNSLNELLLKNKFIDKWDGKSNLYGVNPILTKEAK